MVGDSPWDIKIDEHTNKIYVANKGSDSVTIIDSNSGNTKSVHVGVNPKSIAIDKGNKIYVANQGMTPTQRGSVTVIDAYNDSRIEDIPVGNGPSAIAYDEGTNMIYVANEGSDTVSVINATTNTKEHDIHVGDWPSAIAYNERTHMIYVANKASNTISVIHTDKVQAGVIFNVKPTNSGKIICKDTETAVYPTNTYLYVDAWISCVAQPNKDFEFNTWVESPLTNRNSSIPLESPGNLTVNQYGIYTANFKPLPPPIPPEYWTLIITLILTSVIGWSIPSIFGWVKATAQRKHLEECIDQIGKLDKNAIEDKIKGYYVHGKISEEHRQFLKDKISEYYGSVKGSESGG